MSATQFAQPILAGGLRLPSFFNGRLLSAEDLSQQQDTLQRAQHRLGMAVGAGVAFGLEVSELRREGGSGELPRPILQVTKGLAVNLVGQPLWLEREVELPFLRPLEDTPAVGGNFQDCGQPDSVAPAISGSDGVYILTIAPAEQPDGLAPVSGLGNRAAVCNHKELVQGVQFQLKLLFPAARFAGAGLKLRNRVAYACFGTPSFSRLDFTAPTQPPGQPGALDLERPGLLADSEVPLAVLCWTRDDSLQFVDMWAVRRRCALDIGERFGTAFAPDRREGEARFCQFQQHVERIRTQVAGTASVTVTDYFDFLPAAGLVPIIGGRWLEGFDRDFFVGSLKRRAAVHLDAARLGGMFEDSFSFPAVTLASREFFWLYWVRENQQSVVANVSTAPQEHLVFASGHLPFVGEALFDRAYWNYSNFI